jgi:hypothetical protein
MLGVPQVLVECFWIEEECASRSVAVRRAQRGHENSIGPAMHSVRRCISRALKERLRLDDFHDLRLSRIGLRIENVDPRRVDPRHDQEASLHVRMRRVRTEARTARVPTEVMKFVAGGQHVGLTDETTVGLRLGIDVHDAEGVGCAVLLWIDQRDVGQLLWWRLRRQRRRRIERRVGCQQRHGVTPRETGDRCNTPILNSRGLAFYDRDAVRLVQNAGLACGLIEALKSLTVTPPPRPEPVEGPPDSPRMQ